MSHFPGNASTGYPSPDDQGKPNRNGVTQTGGGKFYAITTDIRLPLSCEAIEALSLLLPRGVTLDPFGARSDGKDWKYRIRGHAVEQTLYVLLFCSGAWLVTALAMVTL